MGDIIIRFTMPLLCDIIVENKSFKLLEDMISKMNLIDQTNNISSKKRNNYSIVQGGTVIENLKAA